MLTSGVRALTGRGCTGPVSVDYAVVLLNALCLKSGIPNRNEILFRFFPCFARNLNIPAVKGMTIPYRIGSNLSNCLRRLIRLRCLSIIVLHLVAINSFCPCAAVGIEGDGYDVRLPICLKGDRSATRNVFHGGRRIYRLRVVILSPIIKYKTSSRCSCYVAQRRRYITGSKILSIGILKGEYLNSTLTGDSALVSICALELHKRLILVGSAVLVLVRCIVDLQDVFLFCTNRHRQNILSAFIECIILRAYRSLLGELHCTLTIAYVDSYSVANICRTVRGRTCRSIILHTVIIILNRVSALRICDFDIRIADLRLCGLLRVLNLLSFIIAIRIA